MRKLVVSTVFAAAIASAQTVEVGMTAGGGAFGDFGRNGSGAQAGGEACVFCGGRFALFGEYTHWFSGGWRPTDLAGFGLRIQGGDRVRPFFDVGAFGGRDQHGGLGGVVLGPGVRIAIGERWYIRPHARFYGSFHAAVIASVGIGYGF